MLKNLNSFIWMPSKTNLPYLQAKINSIENIDDYEIHVRPRKDKRTLEQNSRLWSLYQSIGDHIGISADDVHELMGYKFLKLDREINKQVVVSIKSTTKLNTNEMADYQMKIESWAATEIGWSW
jgi:hypothetical protein